MPKTLLPALLPLVWFVPMLLAGGCTQTADPTNPSKPPPPVTETPQNTPPTMSDAQEIAPNAPLEAGRIVFQGMVRPTKGGYDVRGAIVGDDLLPKALASSNISGSGSPSAPFAPNPNAPGADAKNAEWFLGAVVRITGHVRKHEETPASDDGIVEQRRSGSWFEVERIESASVVKPAEMIEGTLARSKGLFAIAGRLVTRDDVAWSLSPQGGKDGDKVRFYGQSRTVVCEPNTQCLIEGSLPMFDVGRAERLP